MATAPTDAVTAPDPRRAKKLAARKERERKSREAKRKAQGAEEQPPQARKRHRVVKNNETLEWAKLQARRWLENERRKIDKGGLTPKGIEHFINWTRDGDLYDFTAAEQCTNANVAIERFLNEKKGAQQAQGKDVGVKDWWAGAPRLPRSRRKRWAKGKGKGNRSMEASMDEKGDERENDESSVASLAKDNYQATQESTVGDSANEFWTSELALRLASNKEDGKGDEHHDGRMKTKPKHLSAALADVGVVEADGPYSSDMTPEPVSRRASEEAEASDVVYMDHEPVLDAGFEEGGSFL